MRQHISLVIPIPPLPRTHHKRPGKWTQTGSDYLESTILLSPPPQTLGSLGLALLCRWWGEPSARPACQGDNGRGSENVSASHGR